MVRRLQLTCIVEAGDTLYFWRYGRRSGIGWRVRALFEKEGSS